MDKKDQKNTNQPEKKEPVKRFINRRAVRHVTEYGKQLKEKQKVKELYGLRERQFKNYITKAMSHTGSVEETLVSLLEQRLDNIVFRMGLAATRKGARQLVNHAHFMVNGKSVNIPSYNVRINDVVSLKERSFSSLYFNEKKIVLKKYNAPQWIKLNKDKFEAKVVDNPEVKDLSQIVNLPLIFEFYSR